MRQHPRTGNSISGLRMDIEPARRRARGTKQDRTDSGRLRGAGNWQSDGNPYSGKATICITRRSSAGTILVDNSAGNIFFYGGLKDG
jgi:hypothetical protein